LLVYVSSSVFQLGLSCCKRYIWLWWLYISLIAVSYRTLRLGEI